jgi:hypothetical protein
VGSDTVKKANQKHRRQLKRRAKNKKILNLELTVRRASYRRHKLRQAEYGAEDIA